MLKNVYWIPLSPWIPLITEAEGYIVSDWLFNPSSKLGQEQWLHTCLKGTYLSLRTFSTIPDRNPRSSELLGNLDGLEISSRFVTICSHRPCSMQSLCRIKEMENFSVFVTKVQEPQASTICSGISILHSFSRPGKRRNTNRIRSTTGTYRTGNQLSPSWSWTEQFSKFCSVQRGSTAGKHERSEYI